MKISNMFGEELDVEVSGKGRPLVFVHGFGTDKNEGFASFLDASEYFSENFTCIRFDHSGYGKSGGKDYEFDLVKAASDYAAVFKFSLRFGMPYVWAHSLGGVVASLFPLPAERFAWTSPVPENSVGWLKERIRRKGGRVDESGISVYKRSSGVVQLIGKDFWKTLSVTNIRANLLALSRFSDIRVFRPMNDELFSGMDFSHVKDWEVLVPGDHNFRLMKDRRGLFAKVMEFLSGN